MRSISTVPQTSICHSLHVRKQRLARVLDSQLVIARKLSNESVTYTPEVKHAWEIVEELSQKLDKVSKRLEDCICDERDYFARQETDTRLSEREYEL